MTLAVVLIAAYLLGSIPTSYIVVYRYTGRDVRALGNGNPGTMNVLDSVGVVPALIVGAGDISKGMAAVGLAYLVGLGDAAAVAAGASAVIGHDYPVFLRLHGGNGTAAAVGGMAALLPLPTLIAATAAVGVWLLMHSRRVAGVVGLALLPPLAAWSGAPDAKLLGAVLLLVIVTIKILRFEGLSPVRARPPR